MAFSNPADLTFGLHAFFRILRLFGMHPDIEADVVADASSILRQEIVTS
jgi:hypothetical protein